MVLKSPKGIYMQLESGKIIAIRTALKVGHNKDKTVQEPTFMAREMQKRNPAVTSIKTPGTPTVSTSSTNATSTGTFMTNSKASTVTTPSRQRGTNHVQFGRNNSVSTNKNVQMGTAKPYNLKPNARNMPTTSDTSALMQGQYPMSNSNSSFDADISDDSQFLEKLGEDLVNQQNSEDDCKRMNKTKETKCPETSIQNIPNEQQSSKVKPQTNQQAMQSHVDKVNNGIGDMLPSTINDKSGSMQKSQLQSKPEHMGLPYHNMQTVENYNSMNNSNGGNANYLSNQNYSYSFNSNNNGNYNDAQNLHPGQAPQHLIHQTNLMGSQQTEKFQATSQHVNYLIPK